MLGPYGPQAMRTEKSAIVELDKVRETDSVVGDLGSAFAQAGRQLQR